MRLLIAAVLVVVVPSALFAEGHSGPGHLRQSIAREATKLAAAHQTPAAAPQTPPPEDKNWIVRHPVLTGTLIGFGGGFVIGAATCHYPTAEGSSCSDYTYPGNARLLGGLTIGGFGAAIGAGVGALAGALAR
jgi:hypothetical protein